MKPTSLLSAARMLTLSLSFAALVPSSALAQQELPPEAPDNEPSLPGAPPPLPPRQAVAPQVQAAPPAYPSAVAPPAQGQWVNTEQYGWVYMPYAAGYSYAPSPGVAYTYVYSVGPGWRWVPSPWVWGVGARPYFTTGVQYYPWYRPHYWGGGYRWGRTVVGRPYHGGYGRGPGRFRRY